MTSSPERRKLSRLRRSADGQRSEAKRMEARRASLAAIIPKDEKCAAPNCNKPTQGAAELGFSRTLCRTHWEHLNRQGSTWLGPIPATLSRPIRQFAQRWIRANRESADVVAVLSNLNDLYYVGGSRVQNASGSRFLRPTAKAHNIFSALRLSKVPETRLLADWLAVVIVTRLSTVIDRSKTYRHVQIGKTLLRIAHGGSTTVYVRGVETTARFPSRGLYLGRIGQMIEDACSALLPRIEEIIDSADYHAMRYIERFPARMPVLSLALEFLRAPTSTKLIDGPDGKRHVIVVRMDRTGQVPVEADALWLKWGG